MILTWVQGTGTEVEVGQEAEQEVEVVIGVGIFEAAVWVTIEILQDSQQQIMAQEKVTVEVEVYAGGEVLKKNYSFKKLVDYIIKGTQWLWS